METVLITNKRNGSQAEAILNKDVPESRTIDDFKFDRQPYRHASSSIYTVWVFIFPPNLDSTSWFLYRKEALKIDGWDLSPLYPEDKENKQYTSDKYWGGLANFRLAVVDYIASPNRTSEHYDHFGELSSRGFWRAEYHDAVNILGDYICSGNFCDSGKDRAMSHFHLRSKEITFKYQKQYRTASYVYNNPSGFYWFADEINSVKKSHLEHIPGGAEIVVYKKVRDDS